MGSGTHSLTVAADLKNLLAIREFLKPLASASGLSKEATIDLITAVDEAATNIIVHGYHHAPEQTIDIRAERLADGLRVRLLDRAPAYDPTHRPPPDTSIPLEERSVGGLGVYMMQLSVDELSYRPRPGGGNVLTLVKRSG